MPGYYSNNVDFIGYHDLNRKPCFKMAMKVVDGKWYLYLTRLWEPGWTILDVTDPANPRKINDIPGPDNTWTLNVQVADNIMITSLEKIYDGWGGDPKNPNFEDGIYIWDVSDPINPKKLSQWKSGSIGTHRNYYDGGRYVHLTTTMPGIMGYMYVILDIENPEQPREVGRWCMAEQYIAGGGNPRRLPYNGLHGPAYPEGNRAYLGYGAAGMVILDISDFKTPQLVSQLDLCSAYGSSWVGMHTVIPIKHRNLALVDTEAIADECKEPLNIAGIVDISDETKPYIISLFPLPEPPPEAPYRNFSKRGGRFGPHNFHHYQNQPHLWNSDSLVYLTYFNAGLRVYDISDPYLPKEAGYFLPHDPVERSGIFPKNSLVTQTEDVLVDSRGYAYITDKNHGLFIVKYTGN